MWNYLCERIYKNYAEESYIADTGLPHLDNHMPSDYSSLLPLDKQLPIFYESNHFKWEQNAFWYCYHTWSGLCMYMYYEIMYNVQGLWDKFADNALMFLQGSGRAHTWRSSMGLVWWGTWWPDGDTCWWVLLGFLSWCFLNF